MTEGDASVGSGGLADSTDFVEAWRRVDWLEWPPTTRGRAFAVWVGLFDVADADGWVRMTTEGLLERFEIARNSWFSYRGLLVAAGLVEVERSEQDKRATVMRLVPPVRPDSSR